MDVPEETKKRLRATSAELDMTMLLHEIFLPQDVVVSEGRIGQDRLDAITKRRKSLVIKKRGSYVYISGELTT